MKKLRGVLLIVFVVSALALALVACNETAITEHTHRWSEWSVDTATCTAGGTQTRTCTSEGCTAQDGKPATETRTTNALGHNVTSWTLCEADHSKHEGVCSRTDCGVTVTEAHHANAAGTECVDCGATLGGSEQCLHPNASAASETAATCTSAKIEHWTCPDCVWTEDKPIGTPLGHDYTDVAWTPIAGGKHERECARGCGDKQTETCDNKGVITGTAPTCEAAGRENGTKCSVCGGNETLGKVIDALDHDAYKVDETAATCTTNKVEHWACHRCEWTDDKEIVDTALDHDYTDVAWTPVAGGTHERECTRCDYIDSAECDHNGTITGTAATCEAAGRENGTKCSVCGGNEVLGEVINALGHAWSEWSADTATCTAGGMQERTCERDGCDTNNGKPATETRTTTALGHAWSEWSADTATCTQGGTQERTCERDGCDTNDTRTTAALGHNVTSWARSEDDHNKHEGVCERTGCGETIKKNHHSNAAGTECDVCHTPLEGGVIPCEHPNAAATSETAATCTSAKIEHWECPDCHWTNDVTVGEALGHDYADVVWTAVAGGTHERECARGCGDKQTGDCDHNGVITGTTPTCTAAGRENGTKCSVCGGNETLGEVIEALGHVWSEWSADTATCTAGGTQTRTCERVGCDTNDGHPAVDTRTTDALGHDKYIVNETAASCTTNKVEHWACSRCDWTDDKEIAETALGHDYTDVAWAPADGGTHERSCARGCGDKQTGTCDNDTVVVGTAPTCEAAGRENGTKCSVCGGNEVLGEVISALGHAWGEWSADTATCTADGTQTRTCTRDGCDTNDGQAAEETRTTTALGHSLSIASVTPATCTAAQVNHMACGRCDYTEDQTEGEALGHDYASGGWTAVDDGTHHAQQCSRCDALDLDNKHAAEWGEYGVTADETQHYQICQHCDVQSAPVAHSATTYTYASNGEHSGECACGKTLIEKCELADGANACSVCGRIVGSDYGVGDFTVDFSTYGNTNIEPMTDIEIDGVTVSFAKGSASTHPRYWANDKGMRTYKGNVLTVTAPKGGKITSIGFTGAFSSDSAGYNSSSKTWTGSGETVTLNITVNSNFTKMSITFERVELCYHDDAVVECKQSAATCEGTGILQDCYRCESCGLYFTTNACTEILENAVVDALGHNYGEWISEVAATCVATGTKGHYHCDACDTDFDSEENGYAVLDSLTIAIAPNNHSNLSAVEERDATCGEAGWYAHYVCDGCGKKYETADAAEEYDPAIEALGHDLKYRANGTDKHEQYCARCDYVEEAVEHTATTWVAETDGHHQVCTVCGLDFNEGAHSYTDGECVCGMEEAHEHNYTGTVTKEPTCTEKGVTTFACDGCADTYTEDIDALGHDFTGDVLPITDDATYHATKCSRCDAFDVDNKHAAEWGEYVVTADETRHYRICTHCDVQSAPVDHSITYTYASNGEHSGECACGKILTEACTPEGDNNACTGCGRIIFKQNSSGSNELIPPATSTSSSGKDVTYISGSVTFVLTENNTTKGGFGYSELRFYANNTLTITANDSKITKVEIYAANTNKPTQENPKASVGTQSFASNIQTTTFDGDGVESVTFTAGSQTRFAKIVVYYANSTNCYHDGTVVECKQSAATCEGTGILQDCYRCENCNLYFTTDACTEILEGALVPATGHTYGEWIDEVAATCAATGTKGHFHCSACDTDFDSEYALLDSLTIAIDPNNHVDGLTHVEAKAPTTCDVTDTEHAGHVEYWQCACGVMYADANRDTAIDSVESIYLDHTPDWTTLIDSGHSGECSVCGAAIAEQQHVWNEANTACTICGYEKPAGKHYLTTVIIVDGTPVAGIPAGVTLTWDPTDANGAFDAEAVVTLEISLSGYNLVSVVVTDSAGNESEDWMEVDGAYMGEINDDYTLTITIKTLYTITVNNENEATLAWYDENGETVNALTSATEGTKFKLSVTAKGTITVKIGDETVVADEDGLYAFEVGSAGLTIDITVEVSEQTTTYQFGSANSSASGAISNANLKSKFGSALQSGDSDVVSSVSATNVYSTTANTDNLKFGSSSKQGSLTITFNSNVKVTKIVITAKMYSSDSSAINIDGNNSTKLESNAKEFEFEVNGEGSVTINITGKRGYIDSIVIYYE